MAAPPIIPTLPAAPNRNDAPVDFSVKADAFVAALPPMVAKENELAAWMNENAAGAAASATASANSATASADSATSAATQVTLAADQVALAADQVDLAAAAREGAEAAEAQALVYLQATEAGAGIPPAIPDSFLGTDAEGNPLWKSITIPPAFSVGDILDSSRTLTAPNWLVCDGAAYLQSSYPALFAEIGPGASPFEPVVNITFPGSQTGGQSVAIGNTGNYLALGCASPYLIVYKKSGDNLTLLTLSAIPNSNVYSISWSHNDNYLTAVYTTAPYICIYKRTGDTFTKLADPATLPAAYATGVAFSSDDNYLAVSHSNTPFITIYKREGDVFTKLANPATLPPGTETTCVAWSPDSTYVVFGSDASPWMTIYKRSGDIFTKLADPASVLPSQAYSAAWSPDGNYLAVGGLGTPFLTIYKRTGDTFAKVANPATLPTANIISLAFSADGNFLAMSQQSTATLMYRQVGDVFTKMTTAITTTTGVSFSPDSRYLAGSLNASPGAVMVKEANYNTKTEFITPTLTQPGTFAAIKRYIKA